MIASPDGIDSRRLWALTGYKPHAGCAGCSRCPKGTGSQWDFHNSTARFKVAASGRRYGKSRMAAADKEAKLFQIHPDGTPTKGWIVGPCVDETTEILTRRGWVSRSQLAVGEDVLTLRGDGLAEWAPVQDIAVYPGVHEMIHIRQRGHDSLTTPHHRWLVGYTGSTGYRGNGARATKGFRFTTTEKMTKPNEFVLGGAPVVNIPQEPKYIDAIVELIGWYWTEGSDTTSGAVRIAQNQGPNTERIEAAAARAFGPGRTQLETRTTTDELWVRWRSIKHAVNAPQGYVFFNTVIGKLFREIAPDKVISAEWVAGLTLAQLELLIDTSVRADGHERIRPNGARERVVIQKRKDRLGPIQMAAQLAGYQTTLRPRKGDMWMLTIFERSRMFLGQKKQVAKREHMTLVGTVWCPKTPNGTWLARRNGTVFFTGNTYKTGAKEFEYMHTDIVARACKGLPGIRHAFNVRTGEMYIIMPWGSSVEVRSADHADQLVSEGLDWVIVTEAAKQDRKVWEKYLRPALADFRGEAIFPSTPEGANWFKDIHDKGLPGHPDSVENGGEWESWNFPSWCNPIVYPKGYDDPEIASMMLSKERDIDDPWFDQEIAAAFTSFVGKVYGEFSERIHVRSHQYEPEAPNYLAQDYGYTDPFVALDVQVLPGDRLHIWREYYVSGLPVHQHAQELNKRGQPTGYAIRCGFGDPADPGAIVTMSQMVAPTIGDPRMKADISWIDGIREVKKFLALREVKDPTTGIVTLAPGLTVDPSCANTIWEFNNYRIKQPRREDENTGDKPRHWANHAMDALRYLVVHLFLLGAQYHLAEFVSVPVAVGASPLGGESTFSGSPAGTESYFSTSDSPLFTLGPKDF